ncbi:ATP-binding protein [Prevotella sp. E13-17]|uniref:AAA family ATPase n=1 Tax=Prevotella sp. E13-17 TaxID=2913616 RepID=UPI001EDA15FF|nr:AAA family ATPase [Prevotella sp. E13-17]UKK50362.1 ATP-binding protein [Prevotella sp. E13-17]
MSFVFRLISKCFQDASGVEYGNAHFLIEENDWNDYDFYVMYHLHATPLITGSRTVYLGYIKIMKSGQEKYDEYLLRKALGKQVEFEELPEDFVSLTQSIDVFDGLNNLLKATEKKDFVKQMHLILSTQDDDYYSMVEGQEALINGLLRDSSMESYSLKRGKKIMLAGETHYDLRKEMITASFANVRKRIPLQFSCLPDVKTTMIPNGVMTFIGKNGSGKSTLIYHLAKIMYAYPDQRFRLKEDIGTIEPIDIGISKLFLISYSPFDNFVLPGIGGEDYRLLVKGMETGKGRLVFCGIRDVKSEFERILNNPNDDTYNELFKQVRLEETSLKSVSLLATECMKALGIIYNDRERKKLWDQIREKAAILFPDIEQKMYALMYKSEDEAMAEFLNLSTGFKYYLHALSHVIAYIERDSMILFDEPENHIHPPMLSFMMSSLRYVIAQYNSILMVATHSPVIVQESFAENVYVVRNDNGHTTITHPRIETYGANIGEITSEVFDLTTDVSNYYEAYNKLYDTWSLNEEWGSVDEMLESFNNHMRGKVSNQMLSYIISRYYDEHSEEEDN